MRLSNTYAELPDRFYEKIRPSSVRAPRLLLWNAALAEELGFGSDVSVDRWAQLLSGNEMLEGSDPLAIAYAGHQFGHFVPQLGDGRAHLLGEVVDTGGTRRDVQLKGSGPTAFSRRGDGRCALGPAVREFLMSEAMFALGVPTTRCLAVVSSGELVMRDGPIAGAVVTRVAASHLRVGTFEYFAARGDVEALQALTDFAIKRHYPKLFESDNPALAFLLAVMEKQIELVLQWLRVGFIHGVMNTDNTAISGETIDYGPCAMMNAYDPRTVFSSIDTRGRYAFGNQPFIIGWNMARLAECLLPLIHADEQTAVELVGPHISTFPARFEEAHRGMMGRKLGLSAIDEEDHGLVSTLLEALEAEKLDYTVTFDKLGASLTSDDVALQMKRELPDWFDRWRARIDEPESAQALMRLNNPVVIPRNHQIEAALRASESDDLAPAERLLGVLRSPYAALPETPEYQSPPADRDAGYKTFCGT